MSVGRDYMLKKPAGPSAPKLFLDTQVVPWAVNMAARAEVALDRAAARTGVRPAIILAGLTGAAGIGLYQLLTRLWPNEAEEPAEQPSRTASRSD